MQSLSLYGRGGQSMWASGGRGVIVGLLGCTVLPFVTLSYFTYDSSSRSTVGGSVVGGAISPTVTKRGVRFTCTVKAAGKEVGGTRTITSVAKTANAKFRLRS